MVDAARPDAPACAADEGWRVEARSDAPGWLPVPALAPVDRTAWVDGARDELRADWGERWQAAHEALVGAALEHALDSRAPEDALLLQLWPIRMPYAALVHVALVAPEPELDWDAVPGDLTPLELDGVGPAVQRAFAAPVPEGEGELVGLELVAMGADAGVLVRLEPTLPDMLAVVAPAVLALADTLVVTGPGGPLRALPPRGERLGGAWSMPAGAGERA